MPTEKVIKDKYKRLHDNLSKIYYEQKPTEQLGKTEFDTLHGQIWDAQHDELIEAGHISILEPPRDLAAEIDKINTVLGI